MNLCLYAKMDVEIFVFDNIVNILKDFVCDIEIIVENRRCFRNYDYMLTKVLSCGDIVAINDLRDLGSNNVDIMNRLNWFVDNNVVLVINSMPSTYLYGVEQLMNKAVLSTLLQSMLMNDPNVLMMTKKPVVGRRKMNFPDNWDDLFQKWENHEISSKQFMIESGLKKATFYNLLTEYRRIQKLNDAYMKKYKRA